MPHSLAEREDQQRLLVVALQCAQQLCQVLLHVQDLLLILLLASLAATTTPASPSATATPAACMREKSTRRGQHAFAVVLKRLWFV